MRIIDRLIQFATDTVGREEDKFAGEIRTCYCRQKIAKMTMTHDRFRKQDLIIGEKLLMTMIGVCVWLDGGG